MFFQKRQYKVNEVDTPEELAEKLTGNKTWTLCTGWKLGRYYLLNDSTSEDGAREWAIFREENGELRQIESVTFSWCTMDEALGYLKEMLDGAWNEEFLGRSPLSILQHPDDVCALCE